MIDWLKRNMKKAIEELQPIEDLDDFLPQIGKAKEQNKAKKFSKSLDTIQDHATGK